MIYWCTEDTDFKLDSHNCNVSREKGTRRDGHLRLGIRKKFFTVKVVKHWNRLLREAVDAPPLSLEAFMAKLDGALRNLV